MKPEGLKLEQPVESGTEKPRTRLYGNEMEWLKRNKKLLKDKYNFTDKEIKESSPERIAEIIRITEEEKQDAISNSKKETLPEKQVAEKKDKKPKTALELAREEDARKMPETVRDDIRDFVFPGISPEEEQLNLDLGKTTRSTAEETIEKLGRTAKIKNLEEKLERGGTKENVAKITEELNVLRKEKAYYDEKNKKEKGFKDTSVGKTLATGARDTLGSIFGVRSAWEIKKLYDSMKNKGNAEEATLELLKMMQASNNIRNDVVEEKQFEEGGDYTRTMPAVQVEKKTVRDIDGTRLDPIKDRIKIMNLSEEEKNLFEEDKEGRGPVRQKLMNFNEKLKNVNLPEAEKKELRHQMAVILKERRHSTEKIDKQKTNEIGKVFDVFASNSAQRMVVAREVINTVSIFAMMPWLRTVGYAGFAAASSIVKAENAYDKKHFGEQSNIKEKLSSIGKAITIDSAKETFHGLTGNFFSKEGKKKGFWQRVASFGSAFGSVLRIAGIAEFEHALQAGNTIMTEGGEKFGEALMGGHIGEALKQGGENWVHNTQRVLSYIHLSQNPDKIASNLIGGAGLKNGTDMGVGHNLSHSESPIDANKLMEDAKIGKGEGIIHTFQRQIMDNPKAFGYHGDPHNIAELHKFAAHRGYGFAVKNGYVNPEHGTETRIHFDPKHSQEFILHPDGSVQEVDAHKYIYNYGEETRRILDTKAGIDKSIAEIPGIGVTDHDMGLDHKLGFGPGGPFERDQLNLASEMARQHHVAEGIESNPRGYNDTYYPRFDGKNYEPSHFSGSPVIESFAGHDDLSLHNLANHTEQGYDTDRAAKEILHNLTASSKPELVTFRGVGFQFSFNNNHELVAKDFGYPGPGGAREMEGYLKDGWRTTALHNNTELSRMNDMSLARSSVEPRVMDRLVGIYRCKSALNELIAEKKGNGLEAEHVRVMLDMRIADLRKDYGDIIKNPDDVLKVKPVQNSFFGEHVVVQHNAGGLDQKADAAFGQMHKDAAAFSVFEKEGISYDEKMNALRNIIHDGERIQYNQFDVLRKGNDFFLISGGNTLPINQTTIERILRGARAAEAEGVKILK